MNKQELIDELKKLLAMPSEVQGHNYGLRRGIALAKQLDEPVRPPEPKPLEIEKPKVPQVAVEFYERYKDDNLALGEWFGDFYSPGAIEEFPRMDELTKWLHDNNNETNRQREFALATLVTLGIDAVEVEKEKLYTVEIPNPNGGEYSKTYLAKNSSGKVELYNWAGYSSIEFADDWKQEDNAHLTESEIKQDFDWAWQFAKEVEEC